MPRIRHSGLFKRCGHAVRAWATCPDPWWFRFHHAGNEYRFSLTKEAGKHSGYVMDKDEARKLQNKYKLQIQEGTFRQTAETAKPAVDLTVGDVMKLYVKQHVCVPERSRPGQVVMEAYIKRLRVMSVPAANGLTLAFESKPLNAVTLADLEVLRRDWKLNTKADRGGKTGPNRALKRLRHFFNWAIDKGHIEKSPFKRGHRNTIHFSKEVGRDRRLEGDEEKRLLEHATTPLMKVLIRAGLETGCRIGELLQLTWGDVKWDRNSLVLRAETTKTGEARDIPITQNLRAVLDMRRHAPDGSKHGPKAFVFGNECGQKVDYKRTNEAWHATCDAAGIEWRGVQGLKFHTLRHEFGSTLLESGAPIHIVSDMLGHADISTTSNYLNVSAAGKKKHMARFEEHKRERETAEQAANQTGVPADQGADGVFRTSFAHEGSEEPDPAAPESPKNPAKSLN